MDAIRRFELNLHATNASLPPSPHSHQASIFLTPETPPPANADTAAFQELENIGRLSFLVDMGFRTVVSEFFAWMTKTGCVHTPSFAPDCLSRSYFCSIPKHHRLRAQIRQRFKNEKNKGPAVCFSSCMGFRTVVSVVWKAVSAQGKN